MDPNTVPPVAEPKFDKGPPTKDNLTMAMLCHLLGALLGILGALIMWLVKKDDHPFIDDQGKEAVNFHLTLLIAQLVCLVISFVTCGFGAILHLVPLILQWVFGIIAAVKANNGEWYRYPMSIRFIQ
jgi:uncharacterized Tic20 family protein